MADRACALPGRLRAAPPDRQLSRINIQTDFLDLHGRLWLDTSEDYVFASKLRRAPLSRLAPVAAHHGLTAGPPARTRSAPPVPRSPNAAACPPRPSPGPPRRHRRRRRRPRAARRVRWPRRASRRQPPPRRALATPQPTSWRRPGCGPTSCATRCGATVTWTRTSGLGTSPAAVLGATGGWATRRHWATRLRDDAMIDYSYCEFRERS